MGDSSVRGRRLVIVQVRNGGLRLFGQHDHGLVSGELALAWRDAGAQPLVSDTLVLATSLHDLSWLDADTKPRWNKATGRPFDFLDFPRDLKFRQAIEGIGRVAELHPYAGLLVSLHYSSFQGAPARFKSAEQERRIELAEALADDLPGPDEVRRDLDLLRLFDLLVLHICLTPPDAGPGPTPEWLRGAYGVAPSTMLSLKWRAPGTLACKPFPFGSAPLTLEIPFRDLAQPSFSSTAEFRGAWDAAERRRWRVQLLPG